jgi:hypothetical protein
MAEVEHTGEVVDASGSSLKGEMSANRGNVRAVSATKPEDIGGIRMNRERLELTWRTLRSSERQGSREWAQDTELHGCL